MEPLMVFVIKKLFISIVMRQLKNNRPTYAQVIAKQQAKPKNYAACLNTECPHAKECLHAKELAIKADSPTLMVVNPALYTDKAKPCPMFRDGSTELYALGFERQTFLMDYLKAPFQQRCMERIGQSRFYEMRAGLTPIPPHLQTYIVSCAHAVGYNVPADKFFDCRFPVMNW